MVMAVSAQAPVEQVRELVRDRSPIVSKIQPGDRVVIVRERGVRGEPSPYPSAELEMLSLAELEELVAVRQVTIDPFLTADGYWIKTRVTATVTQAFKTGRLALTPGATVSFEVHGGEMIIKGVRVLAGAPPRFDAQRYLVGLQYHPNLKEWQIASLFEITDEEILGPVLRQAGEKPLVSLLHGKSLGDVAAAVAGRK
jgi:hypothetical protein